MFHCDNTHNPDTSLLQLATCYLRAMGKRKAQDGGKDIAALEKVKYRIINPAAAAET